MRIRIKSLLLAVIMLFIFMIMPMITMPGPAHAAVTNYPEVVTGIQALPFHFSRVITATATPITFKLPFKAEVLGVSAHAKVLDTVDGNETYTVDVQEGGTTILSSAISLAAQDTVYEGTLSDTSLADESTITVVLTLGGTTPSLTDLTVLLTLRRTN